MVNVVNNSVLPQYLRRIVKVLTQRGFCFAFVLIDEIRTLGIMSKRAERQLVLEFERTTLCRNSDGEVIVLCFVSFGKMKQKPLRHLEGFGISRCCWHCLLDFELLNMLTVFNCS